MPRSVLFLIVGGFLIGGIVITTAMMFPNARVDQVIQPTQSVQPTQPTQQVGDECEVGGCSGTLCMDAGSSDDLATTCEYNELFGCYKSAICEKQSNGQCGWTQTQEFLQCQNNILQRQNNANH